MAELRFLGFLADVAGVRVKHLVLEKPTPLREILPPSFPDKNIIILIDQKMGNLDTLIEEENLVLLMPILSGG